MFNALFQKISSTSSLYLISLLFLIVTCCYVNTLANGLFFDDEHFIYNNSTVTQFDINGFFSHSLTSGVGKLSNYYRPLLFLGFGIEYAIFKDLGFIYHFDSYIIHFLGGVFLYLLLQKLFNKKTLSFFTTLLFLIHPIQTEAVSYASGRGDPLSFLFIMLTLYLSIAKQKKYHILSFFTLICALLSKEIALITPGLIFLVHLFYQQKFTWSSIKKSTLISLPIIGITLGYFILRVTFLNFANTLNFYNGENIYTSSLFVRLNMFFHLLPSYGALLMYPKQLFMERDSILTIVTVPTIQSVLSFITLLIATVISLIYRKRFPIILFSILWIGISFVPTSGIIPINGIFYEHFLYYPSVGFFLLICYGILSLYEIIPKIGREVLGIIILCCILMLCIRTISRNMEWRDAITFYNQTLSYAPSPRAYNNLAMAYADQGKHQDAIINYKKAIELSDSYAESHYNLANAYTMKKDLTNAEKEYKEALRIDPTFYYSYIKLYEIYTYQQNEEQKEWIHEELIKLAKINPAFLTVWEQLENSH